ncbi:MAG: thiamine-phosphate kinase [Solirubrobacterales bacterium]|nr:thiamine-phosphate kinase [Solirubrobacterales bacterium]
MACGSSSRLTTWTAPGSSTAIAEPTPGLRELELIEALAAVFDDGAPRVLRGLGDDATVVRARPYAITSIDTMVEGVHFRSAQLSGEEIGHRALAGALSDLAAMGAESGEAYLALGLPRGSDREQVLAVARGAQALAGEAGVTIAGGDVSAAPALSVCFAVVGWSDDPGELVGRDGAGAGDVVCVTGELGGSGAGLALIEGTARLSDESTAAALRARYARPRPRLAEGRALAQAGASAMIDISDGLAIDAGHLARRSRARLELSLQALPLAAGVREVSAALDREPAAFAAAAGEDYELCFCVPPAGLAAVEAALGELQRGVGFIPVGKVSDGLPGVVFTDGGQALSGYEHQL